MAFDLVYLEELGILLIDGDRGKKYPQQHEFSNAGHCLFLSTKNVTKSGWNFSETIYIDKEKDDSLRAGKVERGDIILTTRGTIGNVVLYSDEIPFENIRINSGMLILRSSNLYWNSKLLYFILTSPFVKQQIESLTTGSAVPQLPARDLKKFYLPQIPRGVQDTLENFLSPFDNKIQLNRQTNQTLEKMAQALFKSWFVDFDPVIDNTLVAGNPIPDELQDRAERRKQQLAKPDHKPLPEEIRQLFPSEFELTKEMGWVPKGWGSGTLADIASYAKDKINTSELSLENYVSTENMNKGKSGICSASGFASTHQVPRFSVGQTLISNIRPYFQKIWLASFNGGRSNDVLGFQANYLSTNEYLFSLLYQDTFFEYMTVTSKGTKMPRGDKKAIMDWPVVIPPTTLSEQFSKIIKPSYDANQLRIAQSRVLMKTRDTLLPKLISGELRLPSETLQDVEQQLAETIA